MAEEIRLPTTTDVLDRHLTAFVHQDVEEIMRDYREDSVLITNMGTFRGLDEIQGLFENLFAEFAQSGVDLSVDQEVVEGEVAFITWHAETPENVYEFATDTFLVRDGVIETQTFGGKITPKQ